MSGTLPDAGKGLAIALRRALGGFSGQTRIEILSTTPWRSITFAGSRHRLKLHLAGPTAGDAADHLRLRFAEADLDLHGHILADIAATCDERDPDGRCVHLLLEALTVEACLA